MMFNTGAQHNMPPAGNNPAAAGYGPPAEQGMEEGRNQGYAGAYGAPGGLRGHGQLPAGVGGNGPTGMPSSHGPLGAAPGAPAAYSRMSSTSPMNLVWFLASCCVMLGAFISCIVLLFSFEWVDALQMAYLFLFGLLLALLDTPLFNRVAVVSDMRICIGKYVAVLQRVAGKGAAYIFLGCALASSMYANVEGGFMIFLAVVIGFIIVFIGVLSIAIAILKSRNLNLVRLELAKEPMSLKQMYDMHAKMNPVAGITQEEFKKMTPYARGVSFEQPDISLIFNALSSNPRRDVISLDDLTAWVNGNMMVFI